MQSDFRRTFDEDFQIRRIGIYFFKTDSKSVGFQIGFKNDASDPIRPATLDVKLMTTKVAVESNRKQIFSSDPTKNKNESDSI